MKWGVPGEWILYCPVLYGASGHSGDPDYAQRDIFRDRQYLLPLT